jgi:ribosomal protein S27AE
MSISYLVRGALLDGVLTRPQECSECKKPSPVIAHHDDYAKPLEVRWLCRQCHQHWHYLNGEGLNYHLSGLKPLRSDSHISPRAKGLDYRYQRMTKLAASGKTLNDIGHEFNISRERVRQIIGNPKRFSLLPNSRREAIKKAFAEQKVGALDDFGFAADIALKALRGLRKRK